VNNERWRGLHSGGNGYRLQPGLILLSGLPCVSFSLTRNGSIVTRRTQKHRRRISAHSASGESRRQRALATGQASTTTLDQWTLERRTRVRWFFAFLVFAVLAFLGTQSFAQAPAAANPAAPAPVPAAQPGRYLSEKIDEALLKKATYMTMDQAHKEGLTRPDLPQWDKRNAFEAYYKRLVFGKMKDIAYVGELGTITQSLLDDLDRANRAKTPAAALVRSYIIEIAKTIAPSNYHPATRVNATLLLALADDVPEDPREKKPPVPCADAFVLLVQLYMKPEYPDGVRAAALQGIARHVSLGAVKNPQYRAGVSKLMLELAKSNPPDGRSPAAHAFLQRYAVDILSVLANPNASPDTAQTLVSLSKDSSRPNLIAAYAASKISAIQPGKQKLDNLPDVLKAWAARAADTVDGELARIDRLSPPTPVREQPAMPTDDTLPRAGSYAGGGYGGGMEDYSGYDPGSEMGYDMGMEYGSGMGYDMGMEYGYGMGGMPMTFNPQPLEVITSRRRINHVLQQLQLGATGQVVSGAPNKPAGLLGAATPADKAAFDNWITTIGTVVTGVNLESLDTRLKFVEELKKQSLLLRELSGVKPDQSVAGAAVSGQMVPGPIMPAGMVNAPGMDDPGMGAAPAPRAVANPPAANPAPANEVPVNGAPAALPPVAQPPVGAPAAAPAVIPAPAAPVGAAA